MTFIDHAAAHGLRISRLISDGRWHRVPTDDKPRKRNGAYLWDGIRGVVRNWATMDTFAAWRDGSAAKVSAREWRAEQRAAQVTEARKHAQAAKVASEMLSRSSYEAHPYLAAKGFPAEMGLVLDGELLIPMRDHRTNAVQSLQRITADGAKKFLAGGKARGAVFRLGPPRPREWWLCEGYATGLSVLAALRDLRRSASVVVCFSAENLRFVAGHIKGAAYVMADNDASGTGERCAAITGLPWVMPETVGTDANDLHQSNGLRAVVRLIQTEK